MLKNKTKNKKYVGGKIPTVNEELYVFSKYNVIYRGNIINNYDKSNEFVILDETTYTFIKATNNDVVESALENLSINQNITHLNLFDIKIEFPFETSVDLNLNYMTIFNDIFTPEIYMYWGYIVLSLLNENKKLIPALDNFLAKSDRNPFNFQTKKKTGRLN